MRLKWAFGIVLGGVVFFVGAGQAFADCGPGPTVSGSRTVWWGSGNAQTSSLGGASWNASGAYSNPVGLRSRIVNPAVNYCNTTYFDWGLFDNTHWDARWVRDCAPDNVDVVHSWTDSYNPQAYPITAMQKYQVCYQHYLATAPSAPACSPVPPDASCSVLSIVASTDTSNKSRSFYVQYGGGGQAIYFDGGLPWSPTQ